MIIYLVVFGTSMTNYLVLAAACAGCLLQHHLPFMVVLQHAKLLASLLVGLARFFTILDSFQIIKACLAFAVVRVE